MEHHPAPFPVNAIAASSFLEDVDLGVHLGVQRALAEHKRLGRSIVVGRDGKIVEIAPEDIVIDESIASPPLRQAR